MKYIKTMAIIVAISFVFSACGMTESRRNDYFSFETDQFIIVEEKDTHGGFHGDGSYYLILDCSENLVRAREIIKGWKELPLSENLDLVMFGGERGGESYEYNFAEEAHWPTISNGVYKFVDRHSEATNESDDAGLLNRHSFNFSIAVYDLDTDILYYFEMDT